MSFECFQSGTFYGTERAVTQVLKYMCASHSGGSAEVASMGKAQQGRIQLN